MRWVLTLAFSLLLASCGSWWGTTPEEVVVGRGDTLYSISKRYDLQLRDLIDANNLRPPYTLRIGQVLRVPARNFHVVSKGDTLYSVSRRYGVDVKTLAANNNLTPPYRLAIGQRLAINGKNSTANSTWRPTSSQKPYIATSSQSASVKKSANTVATQTVKVSQSRKTKFVWPVKGTVVSKYGTIGKGRANDGINIKAPLGTTVKAADKGTVAYAGNELKGFGNLILIRHDDGWITAYAHNEKLLVKKGQQVLRGEKIATVGTTGGVNSPQLHFEIRAGKNPVNPVSYLQ